MSHERRTGPQTPVEQTPVVDMNNTAVLAKIARDSIIQQGADQPTTLTIHEAFQHPEKSLEYFGLALAESDIPEQFRVEPAKSEFVAQYTALVNAELRRLTHKLQQKLDTESGISQIEIDLARSNFGSEEATIAYLKKLHDALSDMNAVAMDEFFTAPEGSEDVLLAGQLVEVAFDTLANAFVQYIEENKNIQNLAPGLKQETLRRVEAMIELHEESYRDSLTGLLSKEGVKRFYRAAMQNLGSQDGDTNQVVFVARFDLNSFKDINDLLTHSGADDLLKEIAETLKEKLRDTDGIARAGGDEFVVITTIDRDKADEFAQRILDTVQSITYMDGETDREVGLAGGYYLVESTDKHTSFADADTLADEVSMLAKLGESAFYQHSEALYKEFAEKLRNSEKQHDFLQAVTDSKYKRELEELTRLDDEENYTITIGQKAAEYSKQRNLLDRALANPRAPNTGIYGKILRTATTQSLSPVI